MTDGSSRVMAVIWDRRPGPGFMVSLLGGCGPGGPLRGGPRGVRWRDDRARRGWTALAFCQVQQPTEQFLLSAWRTRSQMHLTPAPVAPATPHGPARGGRMSQATRPPLLLRPSGAESAWPPPHGWSAGHVAEDPPGDAAAGDRLERRVELKRLVLPPPWGRLLPTRRLRLGLATKSPSRGRH